MTPKMLRNAGLTSITALSLALVACGGSSSSAPPAPVNQAPINLSIAGSDAIVAGHVKDYALNATDPEGKTITYTVVASNGTVAVTNNVAKLTAPATAGTVILTMTAKDADGAIATATKAVTVNANQAPVYDNNLVNNGTAEVTAVAPLTTLVNLNATDKDGDLVTVAPAAGVTLPSWAVFNATTKVLTLNPAITDVNVLPYNMNFVATDGFGGTTALTVAVTVNRGVNNPPSTPMAVALTPQNTHVGRELKWTLGAIDPDGDAVTFFQPILSDPEVTFSGSTLIWKPTAATMGKTIYVSAMDARGMQSVVPMPLTLPAVSANNAPSWLGETPGPLGNGTGIANPTLGSYLNEGADYKKGTTSFYTPQQSTLWGTWGTDNASDMMTATYTLQVPSGAKLEWNPTINADTEQEFVMDPDALDTLAFGFVNKGTNGLPAVPGGFTISATTGDVTYVPVDADTDVTFTVAFTANDGLLTRNSRNYSFSGRVSVAPVVTAKLKTGWLDPFTTGDQIPSPSAATATETQGDLMRFEPVSCSNASVWLGNLWFSTSQTGGNHASNLTWKESTGTSYKSYESLVPFTDVAVGYRVRDNFNAVSGTETVAFSVAGQAKLTRKVTHRSPAGTDTSVFETAIPQAYAFVDATAPLAGFYDGVASPLPVTTMTDPLAVNYTIKELKAPSYLLNFPSADVLSNLGGYPANFVILGNGGTGATVADLSETVVGRPFGKRTVSTAVVTPFAGATGTVNFYNAEDNFAANVLAIGTPNSTVPGTISQVDLVAGSWVGTDNVGAPVTQAYVKAAGQGLGTGAVDFNSVTALGTPAYTVPSTAKTFNLVWNRADFDGQHTKLNVTTKFQQVYVAQSWAAKELGVPVYNNLATELTALAANIAPNGSTFFSYKTTAPFSDAANTGVAIMLNNVSYKMNAIAGYDAYNVVLQGGLRTFTSGDIAATMGVRTQTDLHNRNLALVIAPPSALTLMVGDGDASVTIPAKTAADADALLETEAAVATAATVANLSWTAPAVGTAAEYVVEIFNVTTAGTTAPVAKFVTTGTKLELPVGIFTADQQYAFRVRAKSAVGNALEQAWADTLSAAITW